MVDVCTLHSNKESDGLAVKSNVRIQILRLRRALNEFILLSRLCKDSS